MSYNTFHMKDTNPVITFFFLSVHNRLHPILASYPSSAFAVTCFFLLYDFGFVAVGGNISLSSFPSPRSSYSFQTVNVQWRDSQVLGFDLTTVQVEFHQDCVGGIP